MTNLERKIFHCFGCGARGSVLDFIAELERVPIREAAAICEQICSVDPARAHASWHRHGRESDARARHPPLSVPPKLDLDPTHRYLAERGVGPDIAATFGLGYCRHGIMKGRICIPIHDERGALMAYAGRWASDAVPAGTPKYKLPRGFEKRRVLFNLHRVAGAGHLVIVEGYWSVFRLHALGIPAVALMGTALSAEQEALLLRAGARELTLLLDGDMAGREATCGLLSRLAANFFVRVVHLPDGAEPDTLPEPFLLNVLCSRH